MAEDDAILSFRKVNCRDKEEETEGNDSLDTSVY